MNDPAPASGAIEGAPSGQNTANEAGIDTETATWSPSEKDELYALYRQELIEYLQREYYYPRAAMRRRQEGQVSVELMIEPSGRIAGMKLVEGSGHALLDESALSIMEKLRELPPMPSGAGSRPHPFTVPIQFKLDS